MRVLALFLLVWNYLLPVGCFWFQFCLLVCLFGWLVGGIRCRYPSWVNFHGKLFFQPFSPRQCLSLLLRCVSCMLPNDGSCFWIYSVSLLLFIEGLIPLILRHMNNQWFLLPPILLLVVCVCVHVRMRVRAHACACLVFIGMELFIACGVFLVSVLFVGLFVWLVGWWYSM